MFEWAVRSTRIIALLAVAVGLWTSEASAAVAPDAVPDAAAPFSVTFTTSSGPVVDAVTVGGLQAGTRVALACRQCLGQTSVEVVATGARQVFRPRLRVNASSVLDVTVTGRNFSRTRSYRVQGNGLRQSGSRCASVAEGRAVSCRAPGARLPWATMNVCSTSQVGMRAASPSGGRRRDSVAARFRLQYQDGSNWVDVANGASPWTVLGRANRSWQGGYTFRFSGIAGRTFRGVAEFEWRRGKRVVRTAARFTSPRRVSGFSSSVCAP